MRTFKSLQKKYSNQEIAEGYIFPNVLTKKQRENEDKLLTEFRKKHFNNLTPEQKLTGKMLQLKYQMQDYISTSKYDDSKRFGYFLRKYIDMLERKSKDFAKDIQIKPTELSQLINSHRKPSEKILIRLELHSNKNIPAFHWYKVIEKEKEHQILTDKDIRRQEQKHVRNAFKLAS